VYEWISGLVLTHTSAHGAVTSAWAIEIVFGRSLPVGLQLADPGDVKIRMIPEASSAWKVNSP
jgi:hypothetical protein